MTVIKCVVQKNFTVLYNSVLEDPNLSFKAKGLWAYCMSKSTDWQFHVSQLVKTSKEGRDSIYAALRELEAAGLVKKVQAREEGRFGQVDYEIYPFPAELKKCLPQTGFPFTANPLLPNKDSNQIKNVCYRADAKPKREEKKMPENTEKISLQEIFKQAVLQKKDWDSQEIPQAHKILCEYKGLVRDPFRFIEGTISNLRNKKRSEFLAKRKGNQACQKKEKQSSTVSKENSSAPVFRRPPLEISIMDQLKMHDLLIGSNLPPTPS